MCRHCPRGAREIIRRDDVVEEEIVRPMFGDEWTAKRIVPDAVIGDGGTFLLDLGIDRLAVRLGMTEWVR